MWLMIGLVVLLKALCCWQRGEYWQRAYSIRVLPARQGIPPLEVLACTLACSLSDSVVDGFGLGELVGCESIVDVPENEATTAMRVHAVGRGTGAAARSKASYLISRGHVFGGTQMAGVEGVYINSERSPRSLPVLQTSGPLHHTNHCPLINHRRQNTTVKVRRSRSLPLHSTDLRQGLFSILVVAAFADTHMFCLLSGRRRQISQRHNQYR